jgi:hypothetical protein
MCFEPLRINSFVSTYEKHLKDFVIPRYGIPVERKLYAHLYGTLVGAILNRRLLRTEDERVIVFMYLLMNQYILGTRIVRDFFVSSHDDSPRFSESGIVKWNRLVKDAESMVHKGVTYFDVVSRGPVTVRKELFDANIKRVMEHDHPPVV